MWRIHRSKRVACGDSRSFTRNCLLCQAGLLCKSPHCHEWWSFSCWERISPTINSLSPSFYNRKNHIVDRAPISVICWVYDLIVLLFSIITVNKLHNNALNPIQRRWCFRKERCISAGFVNSIESCSPTPQMVKQISHLDSWQATRQGPLGWDYKYFSQPLFVLTSGVQLINKQENNN